MLDFRNLTIEQIGMILNGTGYEVTDQDFEFAVQNDLFKYLGCINGAARYMIGYEDQETDEQMYASIVYVTIGSDKLVADYGGGPEFETDDLEALTKYFADRCN